MEDIVLKQPDVIEENELTINVRGILHNRRDIVQSLQQLVIGRNFKILDFSDAIDGYTEYIEGLKIKNLTTPLLHVVGITILYCDVLKDVEFAMHNHDNQSQIAYVAEGSIVSENNIEFNKGESYFVGKKNNHAIKYRAGSKVILVYLPNLNTIKV